jgi:hypothetical protein
VDREHRRVVLGLFERLGPGEHPFATKYALRSPQIRIEPNIYLDNLVRDFQLWGGHIVIRKFDTPRELAALREPIVINCTGLGAKDLFGDQELLPLKGQLTVLTPQSEVNYHTNGGVPPVPGASLGIHMMARNDGIILGGTSQRGVWSLEPDEAERKRVVDSHIAVFGAMKGVILAGGSGSRLAPLTYTGTMYGPPATRTSPEGGVTLTWAAACEVGCGNGIRKTAGSESPLGLESTVAVPVDDRDLIAVAVGDCQVRVAVKLLPHSTLVTVPSVATW